MKRCLDLFCGAGGAGMGYHRAGFEVVGVDIKPQPHYPFEFHQADALEYLKEHGREFDFIHASPPCQAYSHLTPMENRVNHARMIPAVRTLLVKVDRPYIIENVSGARRELKDAMMLCGSMFGLRTQRHRYFETSFFVTPPPGRCDHSVLPLLVTTASQASRKKRFALGMRPKTVKNAPLAYGIDWMTGMELSQAIPPAYTEFIGKQIIQQIQPGIPADNKSTGEAK